MKKLYLFLLAILCLTGTACEEKEINTEPIECGRIDINENEYVVMQVVPEKIYVNTYHVLRIENHTQGVLQYGTPYSLEYFNGKNWGKIQLNLVWTLVYLGLGASETTEDYKSENYEKNFYSLIDKYNKGKKGKYRIIKDFSVCHNWPLSSPDIYLKLCAEFEIK